MGEGGIGTLSACMNLVYTFIAFLESSTLQDFFVAGRGGNSIV